MRHNYFFKNRWPMGKDIDIVDAMGSDAERIAELVPVEYISNFSNILKCRLIDDILPPELRVVINMRRCGINVTTRDINMRLFIEISICYQEVMRFFNELYESLSSGSRSFTTHLTTIDKMLVQKLLFMKVDRKYEVLKDPSIANHVIDRILDIDIMINNIDVLYEHDAIDLFKRVPHMSLCNETHLISVAWLVNKGHKYLQPLLSDMLSQVGIYDPTGNPSNYVLTSLRSYPKYILENETIRKPLLPFSLHYSGNGGIGKLRFPDYDIIKEVKVILPYIDHTDHVRLREFFVTGINVWFIPTSEFMKECNFTETTLTMEETNETYIIGYGNRDRNSLYSLNEIKGAIDIEQCKWLLPGFKEKPTYDDIMGLYTIMKRLNRTDIIDKMNTYVQSLDDDFKPNSNAPYKEFLISIIEMGLFARRWKGRGYLFPYNRGMAENVDINPEHNIAPLVVKCSKIIQSWNEKPSFRKYNDGGVTNIDFMDYYNQVITGNECIRVASTAFIATGAHYLKSIYNEVYTDPITNEKLDINKLETIRLTAPEERR